jgi:outer membrane protein assembly factor BamD
MIKFNRLTTFVLFLVVIFIASSCKSSFEKLRTSNDPEKVLVAADKYYKDGKYLKAQILYEIVLPYFKGKKQADDIYYNYAYTHYNLEDYILAAHYFKSYSKSFINSPHREECLYMAAYSEYVISPQPQLDQGQTNKAIDDFQLFVNTFPDSKRVETCNKNIDELRKKLEVKEFQAGQLYYNVGKYISAIISLENMLKDYPETNKEEKVRLLILKSAYNYAKNSVYNKKEERYNDALDKYKQYIKKFPKSKKLKIVKKIHKNTLLELKKIEDGKRHKS